MHQLRKAIDIHTHLNHGSPHDTVTKEWYRADLDFLMSEYDNAGILCGGYSTYGAVLSDLDIPAENEYMRELANSHTRVYQWVVIDPRQPATFLQADKMLSSRKCLGVKIHPDCHKYDIKEYAHSLFGFANEKKAVVLMHPQSIDDMPGFVNQYPDMKLIIAHLSGKSHVDAIESAAHGNIYTDVATVGVVSNDIIEYAVRRVGSERILFGTDTYSCAYIRGRIEFARIAESDKENIFYNNAMALFPRKFLF